MSTKEVMKKSSVQTVLDAANSAIEQLETNDAQVQSTINTASALAAVDLQRGFVGDNDLDELPPSGGSSEGDLSWYLSGNKVFQLIQLDSGSWVDFGKPLVAGPKPPLSENLKWVGEKYVNNPVVAGSSNDADQFYPPEIFKDPGNGKFYLFGKSGGKIYLFRSDDGKTGWTEIGLVIDKGTGSDFDVTRIEFSCVRYIDGTYHLLYTGEKNDVTEIGHATSDGVENLPYTKQGSVYDGSDAFSNLGMELNYFEIGDVKIIDGEYIFYIRSGLQIGSTFLNPVIFCATGTAIDDINARNVIFTGEDVNGIHRNEITQSLQRPSVFEYNNTFIMLFTAGRSGVDDYNERAVYAAYGGPYDFTPVRAPVIEVGEQGEWDDRRVYTAVVPVVQDGKFTTPVLIDDKLAVYFAGHDTGVTGNNQGQTGLILFSEIPDLTKAAPINIRNNYDKFIEGVAEDSTKTLFTGVDGYIMFSVIALTNRPDIGIFVVHINDTPQRQIEILSQNAASVFEVAKDTTPTGTTGTDVKTTIHATTSGDVVIENREGSARDYKIKILDQQKSIN